MAHLYSTTYLLVVTRTSLYSFVTSLQTMGFTLKSIIIVIRHHSPCFALKRSQASHTATPHRDELTRSQTATHPRNVLAGRDDKTRLHSGSALRSSAPLHLYVWGRGKGSTYPPSNYKLHYRYVLDPLFWHCTRYDYGLQRYADAHKHSR